METFETRSVRGTVLLGRRLARRLKIGDCVGLVGPLGAGKTVLVRGMAGGLGLEDFSMVSSPTFVLVQEYPASVPVYHVDLYRLSDPFAELAGLGIEEMLAEGVVLVEWADRAASMLPCPHWRVEIEILAERRRRFTVRRNCPTNCG